MSRLPLAACAAALLAFTTPASAAAQDDDWWYWSPRVFEYAGKSETGVRLWLRLTMDYPLDPEAHYASTEYRFSAEMWGELPDHPQDDWRYWIRGYEFGQLHPDLRFTWIRGGDVFGPGTFAWRTTFVGNYVRPGVVPVQLWEVDPEFPAVDRVFNDRYYVRLQIVPEPSTLALLGGGLLALGGVGLRRRRQAGA